MRVLSSNAPRDQRPGRGGSSPDDRGIPNSRPSTSGSPTGSSRSARPPSARTTRRWCISRRRSRRRKMRSAGSSTSREPAVRRQMEQEARSRPTADEQMVSARPSRRPPGVAAAGLDGADKLDGRRKAVGTGTWRSSSPGPSSIATSARWTGHPASTSSNTSQHGQAKIERFARHAGGPTTDHRLRLMAAAPVGMLAAVLGAFVLLEVRSGRVADPDDLPMRARLGVLAVIPPLPSPQEARGLWGRDPVPAPRRRRAVRAEPGPPARRPLRRPGGGAGPRCMMITSACGGEGKTTLAAHLAGRCVNAGLLTLLIDADLRDPTPEPDCSTWPTGGAWSTSWPGERRRPRRPWSPSATPAGSTSCRPGRPGHDPSRLLQGDRLGQLLARRPRDASTSMIVDAPPVLPVPDALTASAAGPTAPCWPSATTPAGSPWSSGPTAGWPPSACRCSAPSSTASADAGRLGYSYGYSYDPGYVAAAAPCRGRASRRRTGAGSIDVPRPAARHRIAATDGDGVRAVGSTTRRSAATPAPRGRAPSPRARPAGRSSCCRPRPCWPRPWAGRTSPTWPDVWSATRTTRTATSSCRIALAILWHRRGSWTRAAGAPRRWGWLALVAVLALRAWLYEWNEQWAEDRDDAAAAAALALALGGWHLLRWALPAIAFLFFMLPLPPSLNAVLAYPLQRLATIVSFALLQAAGAAGAGRGQRDP